ncbi:MAG: hypothetical protein AB7E31_09850 [Desulfitobacterium sp.]
MGVFVQQVSSNSWNPVESHSVPSHLRGLLQEFLCRYRELQSARYREVAWVMAVISLGFFCLGSVMFTPLVELSSLLSILLLVVFFLALKQYLKVRRLAEHVYINVHILYHHLLGKLEVGFCEHESPCQCTENFRKYMWNRYGISFYGNSI